MSWRCKPALILCAKFTGAALAMNKGHAEAKVGEGVRGRERGLLGRGCAGSHEAKPLQDKAPHPSRYLLP